MARGAAATFRILASTANDAADPVLIAALDSSSDEVRTAAVRAALERRSRRVLMELVLRCDRVGDEVAHVAHELPGRLWQSMRELLQRDDAASVEIACRAAVKFHEHELIPALIALLEAKPPHPQADLAGRTLIELSDLLYHELATTRDERRRHDPQAAKRHALAALEPAAQRYREHRRFETIEAFLQLAPRDNAVLLRILCDSRDPAFEPMQQILAVDDRPGVLRLLFGFLEDPSPPWSVLAVLFRRTDRRCIDALLKRIGSEPSPTVRANLRRVTELPWQIDEALLAELDDERQTALVRLVEHAGLKPEASWAVLSLIARSGGAVGRRAALEALALRGGADTNEVVLRALADADSGVRSAALRQVRARCIPGALTTLIAALDDPAADVQDAARANLSEFTFRRYLAAFELLDDDVRESTGGLVRRVDPTSVAHLQEELRSTLGKRRMRGLEAAVAMELVAELRSDVLECATDGDHLVRTEAAKALAAISGDDVTDALRELTNDASFAVRDAATASLAEIERRTAAEARAAAIVTVVEQQPASTPAKAPAPRPAPLPQINPMPEAARAH